MKRPPYLKTILLFIGCLLHAPLFAQRTVINVNPSVTLGNINPGIYRVNQRWFDYDIRFWEPGEGKESKLIKNYRTIGLRSLRYPAGTAADAFDWKRTIGPRDKRAKVIEGHTWELRRNTNPGGDEGNGGYALGVDLRQDEAWDRFLKKHFRKPVESAARFMRLLLKAFY